MSFHELGLSEPLVRAVAAEGYSQPTPIQTQTIPPLLAGRDLIGIAQTGTGKTAAFALPLLDRLMGRSEKADRRPIRCLILAPTRELALQIGESIRTYGRHSGLRSAVVFGGVSQVPQVQALRRGIDILVATPGRLVDLMDQGFIDLRRLEIFILDEADRMLDMGFMPALRRIVSVLPDKRQTALFSATMPEPIMGLAHGLMQDPVRIQIASEKPTVDRIEQSICYVPQSQKSKLLAACLTRQKVERAIVFTRTKHGADRVVRDLRGHNIDAAAIHGNKSQGNRQQTLANFKANRVRVLVATDIAARGIDVDNITHVFNYDLPYEPETYVHRIGRTARAGAAGTAIAFCTPDEQALLRGVERLIKRSLPVDPASPSPAPEPTVVHRRDDRPAHGRPSNRPRQGGHPASRPPARGQRRRGRGRALAGK